MRLWPLLLLAWLGPASAQFGRINRRNRILDTSATCNEESIFFRLNFESPFLGLVYTENQWPQCIYVNGSANPRQTYDVSIPLQGCNTRQLPSGALENAVIVQSDPRVLEATDRKFLLNCHPRNYGGPSTSFTVGFGGVTVVSDLSSTEVVTGAGSTAQLDYTVEVVEGRGPVGRFVQRPLSVGEDISYVVRVADTRGADVRIGACWARDGVSSIQLADDRGCSLQDASNNIWNQFQSQVQGDGKVFWNDIKTWAFPTSSKVDIYCNLHVCPSACPFYQCRRLSRRDAPFLGQERDHLLSQGQDPLLSHKDPLLDQEGNPLLDRVGREDRSAPEAQDDAVLPVEGSFEVTNLGKIDVLNAEFNGHYTGPPSSALREGSGGPVSLVLDKSGGAAEEVVDSVCVSRLHFAVALSLVILIAAILLCVTLACAFRLCGRRGGKHRG